MADLLRMPPCQNLLKAFAEPGNELFVSNSTICRAPNNFASRNSKQPFCPSKAMPISAEEKPTGASQVQVPSGGAARTTESEVSVDHAEMKNGPFLRLLFPQSVSLWREQSKQLFRLANEQPTRMVEVQGHHGGATDSRQSNDCITLPSKMFRPPIVDSGQKAYHFAGQEVSQMRLPGEVDVLRAAPHDLEELLIGTFGLL